MSSSSTSIGRVSTLRREVVRKIRQVGVPRTIAHVAQRVIRELKQLASPTHSRPDPFDSRFGTDTAGRVGVGALDIPNNRLEHAQLYQAVDPEHLLGVLQGLRIAYERFVFIDLGCGKGRALLLASRLPFKEIVGVELSDVLCQIARRNLNFYQDPLQRCKRLRVICQDAVNYQWPDENIVLFLYNPFDEELMRPVVANLERNLRARRKDVYVVYTNPLYQHVLEQSEVFETLMALENCVVFRSKQG